jgi:ferredoxin
MSEEKLRDDGITGCINCIGIHPDEVIDTATIMGRLHHPQKVVAIQRMKFEAKRKSGVYNDKSCMLCGRTYDGEGNLDESWELTKQRVKQEFENAGINNLTDLELNKVVASCVKSWRFLWKHRAKIKTEQAELMTFVGRMTLILTHAQEAKENKKSKVIDKGLIV